MNNAKLIYCFVQDAFPLVKTELANWQQKAMEIPDSRFREQALASIRTKAFHCQGGSIYALYPGVAMEKAVEFVVAYQTMSDYLDNLVDSLADGLDIADEKAFYQLHLAMQEALVEDAVPSDYYRYYPYHEDGGYLESLVRVCQSHLQGLPSYSMVQEDVRELAKLYAHLQTYKHLALVEREVKMLAWARPFLPFFPRITEWEFAAATGSTLGIFSLYAAAHNPQLTAEEVWNLKQAYFPWVCGLHILLDYLIDLEEDRETGQLNFASYYVDLVVTRKRLRQILGNSRQGVKSLPFANFHEAVIQGLLAMYLSDPKALKGDIRDATQDLLNVGGQKVKVLHFICRQLRKRKML